MDCCPFPESVSVSTVLHSEVSVDVTGQVFSVEQEVVADDVECQAGAPVGSWVIGRRSGAASSSAPCHLFTITWFLLLGFFFLTLCDHTN